MDTYDLDEDPGPANAPGTRHDSRRHWSAVLVVLLVVISSAVAIGVDQRRRAEEFTALVDQVTRGQAAIRYSDARIQSMVQQTSPMLISARAPARVRAGLRQLVQQAAADRVAPTQVRRDAVAGLEVAGWHGEQSRARDAYLEYLDQQIAFLRAVSVDLRTLYRPRVEGGRRLATARQALLEVSPDRPSSDRIRALMR
jgi:hypothetical protein